MNSMEPSTERLRLRVFAGPNGSGKTSLVQQLAKEYSSLGVFHVHRFLNADDILRVLQHQQAIDFAEFDPGIVANDVFARLTQGGRIAAQHPFLHSAERNGTVLKAPATDCDAYIAAAIVDGLREELLLRRQSFSFETVMSHPSKVAFLAKARKCGYRSYLYFVATDDPGLNALRVQNRAELGLHSVPHSKILERYHRSLALLRSAMENADRAYLFDNSGVMPRLIAEWTGDGALIESIPINELPSWFKQWATPAREK